MERPARQCIGLRQRRAHQIAIVVIAGDRREWKFEWR
jgi:hypothetical protein